MKENFDKAHIKLKIFRFNATERGINVKNPAHP